MNRTVILAAGNFPAEGSAARRLLACARRVVACDSAADEFLRVFARSPDVVVGDCDSVKLPHPNVVRCSEQDTNDLAKAIRYCRSRGWKRLVIVGATGKREDHTLGNLSLLSVYAESVPDIKIVTDHGYFTVAKSSGVFESFAGMQVSIIALDSMVEVTSRNLKYPMDKLPLHRWYQATLNEALGAEFALEFTAGCELLIYRTFRGK
jgi:thiamine pyrophosphokinase